jgi:hypothetical protein
VAARFAIGTGCPDCSQGREHARRLKRRGGIKCVDGSRTSWCTNWRSHFRPAPHPLSWNTPHPTSGPTPAMISSKPAVSTSSSIRRVTCTSELTYLATIVAWFDAIPRDLPAPLAFRDDPEAEIQVLRRGGCDAVLLCFCARESTLGLPLNLVHQWLGRLPVSLVYIKDFRDLFGGRGYPSLAPDLRSSVGALRSLVGKLEGKRIYTLGVSHGGYPALHYGLELGAAGALSLAGAALDLRRRTRSDVSSESALMPARRGRRGPPKRRGRKNQQNSSTPELSVALFFRSRIYSRACCMRISCQPASLRPASRQTPLTSWW